MKWVKREPKQLQIKAQEIGPAVNHSVLCWACDKESAIYDMKPNWIFRPCWKCQKLGVGNGIIVNQRVHPIVHWIVSKFGR